jgi:acyl-CoA thioesterase-1
MLKKEKPSLEIINAGISGSTTSSGLKRLKWFMQKKPTKVFIALGANDGLRGVDISSIEKNFEAMLNFLKNEKVETIILGMKLPPNYGNKYALEFNQLTTKIAKKHKLKHLPFILKDVGGVKELNLADGIHPNPSGHQVMAKNIYKFIKENL